MATANPTTTQAKWVGMDTIAMLWALAHAINSNAYLHAAALTTYVGVFIPPLALAMYSRPTQYWVWPYIILVLAGGPIFSTILGRIDGGILNKLLKELKDEWKKTSTSSPLREQLRASRTDRVSAVIDKMLEVSDRRGSVLIGFLVVFSVVRMAVFFPVMVVSVLCALIPLWYNPWAAPILIALALSWLVVYKAEGSAGKWWEEKIYWVIWLKIILFYGVPIVLGLYIIAYAGLTGQTPNEVAERIYEARDAKAEVYRARDDADLMQTKTGAGLDAKLQRIREQANKILSIAANGVDSVVNPTNDEIRQATELLNDPAAIEIFKYKLKKEEESVEELRKLLDNINNEDGSFFLDGGFRGLIPEAKEFMIGAPVPKPTPTPRAFRCNALNRPPKGWRPSHMVDAYGMVKVECDGPKGCSDGLPVWRLKGRTMEGSSFEYALNFTNCTGSGSLRKGARKNVEEIHWENGILYVLAQGWWSNSQDRNEWIPLSFISQWESVAN